MPLRLRVVLVQLFRDPIRLRVNRTAYVCLCAPPVSCVADHLLALVYEDYDRTTIYVVTSAWKRAICAGDCTKTVRVQLT